MSKNSIYVLGTHVSHDGSACLLKDGKICVAIEKERVTRMKHDGGNDDDAINYCLNAEGIQLKDVDLLVQNSNFDMFKQARRQRQRLAEGANRIVTISHHLAHAYGSVATSPFAEAAALAIDGCGNSYSDCIDIEGSIIPEIPPTKDIAELYFEKDSYYHWSNNKLRTIFKDFSPFGPRQGYFMHPPNTAHSIGGAYAAVSYYVFGGMDDVGKLMGLAPFGRPGRHKFPMFDLLEGRSFLRYDWMEQFNKPALSYDHFKADFQYYADLAYWCQREIERAILYIANSRYEIQPSENLAFSGGVALNAVANKLLLAKSKYKNIYFMPAASDNGIAIGCAFYGWQEVLGNVQTVHKFSPYLGKEYSDTQIQKDLEDVEGIVYERNQNYIDLAAKTISEGKTIAWFQDRSEFGPRALGHRSILGDPREETMQSFINKSIKFREDFRPFAPSVPLDEVETFFEHSYESPYMIIVSKVKAAWSAVIPAVVHKDNSARVQTVTKEMSPKYYLLHRQFEKYSGIPILLNTSMNRKGEPIVETPAEAINLFTQTALDMLILNDWVVTKAKKTSI